MNISFFLDKVVFLNFLPGSLTLNRTRFEKERFSDTMYVRIKTLM